MLIIGIGNNFEKKKVAFIFKTFMKIFIATACTAGNF